MALFSRLFGRKRAAAPENDVAFPGSNEGAETIGSLMDIKEARRSVPVSFAPASGLAESAETADVSAPAAAMNIWDLDDDDPVADVSDGTPAVDVQVESQKSAAPTRRRRAKTRLLGFDKSDGQVVDLFQDQPAPAEATSVKFPVGWIVIADGPGRGASFSLMSGMSQIGRGDDQSVQLDFGDTAISRTNHAAIVYDPETHEFLLGQGGKNNIVRLNGSPIISNEKLSDGDSIRIAETTLRFAALCNEDFNWTQTENEEEENDVEIA